jgi:hypothetical protein
MSKRSRTKKSNRIKRKASKRSRLSISYIDKKAEAWDMRKDIESIKIRIGQSAEEAEASEMRKDRNGVKMRSLITFITIVKTAKNRIPKRLSLGLICKPSHSKQDKRRKILTRIGGSMTAKKEMIIAKTATMKIKSHTVTRNPTKRITMMVEK